MFFDRRLKGDRVIKEAYSFLSGKHSYETITLPGNGASPIIANDSDYHRTRLGRMNYKRLDLAEIEGKPWALGLGKAWGDYPAKGYGNDIIAIGLFEMDGMGENISKMMKENPEEYLFSKVMEGNFHNSLIHTYNGRLRLIGDFVAPFKSKFNPFGKRVLERIRSRAQDYVFVERKPGERGNLLVTIYPSSGETEGVFDHPEYPRRFANAIAESMQSVLSGLE